MKRALIILLSVLFTQCACNDGLTEIEKWNKMYKNEIDVHYGIGQSSDPIARHIIAFESAIFKYTSLRASTTNNADVVYSNTLGSVKGFEENIYNFDIDVLSIYIEEDTEYIALRFKEGDKYCCGFSQYTEYSPGSSDYSRLNSDDRIYLTINQNNEFSDNQGELVYSSRAVSEEKGNEQIDSIWTDIRYECHQNEQYKYDKDNLESNTSSHFVEIK